MALVGSKPLFALTLDSLIDIAMFQGEYDNAAVLLEKRILQAEEIGDIPTMAQKRLLLGDIVLSRKDFVQAESLAQQSLAFFQRQDDSLNISAAFNMLDSCYRVSFLKNVCTSGISLSTRSACSRFLCCILYSRTYKGASISAAPPRTIHRWSRKVTNAPLLVTLSPRQSSTRGTPLFLPAPQYWIASFIVTVFVGLGIGSVVGVGAVVGVGVGNGVGDGVGLGVGDGVGDGVGWGVEPGVGRGVECGVGRGLSVGAGRGLGVAIGIGAVAVWW